MGYELKNTQRSSSILRCVDAGTYTVNLQDLAANTGGVGETINSSAINLAVTIVTGGSLVMEITKDTSYNVALTGF